MTGRRPGDKNGLLALQRILLSKHLYDLIVIILNSHCCKSLKNFGKHIQHISKMDAKYTQMKLVNENKYTYTDKQMKTFLIGFGIVCLLNVVCGLIAIITQELHFSDYPAWDDGPCDFSVSQGRCLSTCHCGYCSPNISSTPLRPFIPYCDEYRYAKLCEGIFTTQYGNELCNEREGYLFGRFLFNVTQVVTGMCLGSLCIYIYNRLSHTCQ